MKKEDQYRHVLENTLGIPFTENNSVDVFINGNEIFPAMLEAIENAEEQVDFLTFVYWSGDVAEKFARTLAKKSKEGLTVRVILDCYGAAFMPGELADIMTDAGVNVQWFRPFAQWKVWKTDNRTHRKVLVCDGKVAFTGGVGIAEEWEGDARDPSEYRDTHFRVRGKAVYGLQAAFMENWVEADGFVSLKGSCGPPSSPHKVDEGDIAIQMIRTSASVRWSDIVMLYQTLIQLAQESIHITTAYFNPDINIIKLLIDAVERGVEVSIIMPGKYNDMRMAKIAGEETFEQLLDGGVKLWYYQKTMYHTKKILVDGILSCIGSANFNHRSMLKDDEINLVCLSKELTQELLDNFKVDLNECEKIDRGNWERRSYIKRSVEKIVNLGGDEI